MGEQSMLEKMGKGVPFVRVRRITGYITEDMSTWNNAKKSEEKDRVKHEKVDESKVMVA